MFWAAWLGWGFDACDGLLFNYVAPSCLPTLVGIPLGTPEAQAVTALWTGRLTSLLLVGWAVGGIVFGWVADRVGRSRTLVLTISLYSLGTALCAVAPNLAFLILFRAIASLGIGGEWAAGASLVAEIVPPAKRVAAGALLYCAAPVGILGAAAVNLLVAGWLMPGQSAESWRWVFACGAIPALVALLARLFLREPEVTLVPEKASIAELFRKENRYLTLSGVLTAVTALMCWWSMNAFMPLLAGQLAQAFGDSLHLTRPVVTLLQEQWKLQSTLLWCLGGLLGTLATIPIANRFGRRAMFLSYFLGSVALIMLSFGLDLGPQARLWCLFPMGLTIFGLLGSFTFYLPELFPAHIRATGSGFCYNVGRVLTAFGPLVIGQVAQHGPASVLKALFWIFVIPLVGALCMPLIVETHPGLARRPSQKPTT